MQKSWNKKNLLHGLSSLLTGRYGCSSPSTKVLPAMAYFLLGVTVSAFSSKLKWIEERARVWSWNVSALKLDLRLQKCKNLFGWDRLAAAAILKRELITLIITRAQVDRRKERKVWPMDKHSVWPDLAKFHHSSIIWQIFEGLFKYLGKKWTFFYSIGQNSIIGIGQILKEQSGHPVTLPMV